MDWSSRALRSLAHPISLSAIGLLLVNDHLLKPAFGNALTGKLSDFAGLAFFPLLIAAALGPIAGKRSMVAAVTIAGSWFTAIKINAPVAELTETFVEGLFGFSSQITADPTDLVALPAMAVACRTWEATEHRPAGPVMKTVALLTSLVATTATSYVGPDVGVLDIDVSGDTIIAAGEYRQQTSTDLGETWTEARNDHPDSEQTSEACHRSGLCLRSIGDGVEESLDNGETWEHGWSFPPGRSAYVRRLTQIRNVVAPTMEDIAFVDRGADVFTFVAMGTDGVLRRNPDGSYDRNVDGSGWVLSQPGEGIAIELGVAAVFAVTMIVYVTTVIIGRVREFWVTVTLSAVTWSAAVPWMNRDELIAPLSLFATIPVTALGVAVLVVGAARDLRARPAPDRLRALLIGPATGLAFAGLAYGWSAGWIERLSSLYLTGLGAALIGVATVLHLLRGTSRRGPTAAVQPPGASDETRR